MPDAPLVYLNGSSLPAAEAHLPLNDAGFIFGATVTDLCRTFGHQLFRLPDHLARFRRSCTSARIPQPRGDAELSRIATELVEHNGRLLAAEHDLALVMFATPGPVGYYLGRPGGPGDGPPTLCMHTFPLPLERYARLFREGARLVIPPTRHVPAACVDPRVKQRSRLHWWLAEREAHALVPGSSALLLDAAGHVTETAAANLLVVRAGTVLSPPRDTVLAGVSLQTVEEVCGELGLPFAERPVGVHDCVTADEAFLSCTSYCLAPVRQIDGVDLPCPGPVYERLLAAWSARVGLDIRGQILSGALSCSP
jgi:branched-subunit amino acid aminotransferase/4-amino-4-deoxychorismate lyase